MNIYADYEFYSKEYLCGKEAVIDAASFNFYARKATQKIKEYTFSNVPENVPEEVKMCCCELAELFYRDENSSAHKGIASESVGDVSVSYENSENCRQAVSKDIKSVIYTWLADIGLCYRGVSRC